jgi:xanthine dehydrogenase small subunit
MASRNFVVFYINGERVEARGDEAFLMLSDFLRYRRRLTGTKVVCSEGDCGACGVLRSFPQPGAKDFRFHSVNSCILPVFLADCSHLITIEGLREEGKLNELQDKMCAFNGAQCGFCTPGIVMALTEMFDNKSKIDAKTVKNYLTGNLCRCTGYQPIIDAACAVDTSKLTPVHRRYANKAIAADLAKHLKIPVELISGNKVFYSPVSAAAAAKFKGGKKGARVYSAATDLGVHINKGLFTPEISVGLSQIPALYTLKKTGNRIYVGAKVTLTQLEKFVAGHVPELESFLRIFASAQIKNVATLAGNVVNGSPIGDTLPFLQVAGAVVELQGRSKVRKVEFTKFYKGYRKADIKADEIVTGISFEIPAKTEVLRLFKVSQRKDLDISCVNAGFRLSIKDGKIDRARIAFGGVGPTVLSLPKTEAYLRGRTLDKETVEKSLELIAGEIAPRSDVRGQAEYRLALSQSLFKKFAADVAL